MLVKTFKDTVDAIYDSHLGLVVCKQSKKTALKCLQHFIYIWNNAHHLLRQALCTHKINFT